MLLEMTLGELLVRLVWPQYELTDASQHSSHSSRGILQTHLATLKEVKHQCDMEQ